MKKIVNKYPDIDDSSVLDVANNCLKTQKNSNLFNSWKMKLYIAFFVISTIFSLIGNPFLVISNVASLCVVLAATYNLQVSSRATITSLCNRMAWMVKNYSDTNLEYSGDVEIEIVPKNIKIGENLEAVNIIPIFKEGKYVVIKSMYHPCFIRVFDNDGEEEAYAMEPIDEDIQLLESEIPEYKEYIDVFKLQKKLPYDLF